VDERNERERFVIFMHGYTAFLKSVTARRLSHQLHVFLVETNKLGPCIVDEDLSQPLRDRRYEAALRIAKTALHVGGSVVLDGTFGLRRWREDLYRLCQDSYIETLVMVRCVCEDDEILQIRLNDRKRHPDLPESEVHTWKPVETTRMQFKF
jgi:predicted kinase